MSLGIRWALVVLVVAYGLSTLAAVENFNEMIAETTHEQNKLSSDIQTQLQITSTKATENTALTKSASLKEIKVRIIKIN